MSSETKPSANEFVINLKQVGRHQKLLDAINRDKEAILFELRQKLHDLAGDNQRLRAQLIELRTQHRDLCDYTGTADYLRALARVHGYDLVKRPEVESKGEAIAKAMKK